MEEVCPGTGMMSFGKVPCTPVTGAYVNFYDIFGDVERIGTGSSHDSSSTLSTTSNSNCNINLNEDDEHPSAEKYKGKRKCSKSFKYNAYDTDPYILFLQEKQVEILGALHEEIRSLKSENADLKFQIHVILRNNHLDDLLPSENIFRGKKVPSTPEYYLGDLNGNRRIKDREKTLELELESAAKMIEELSWIKQHYEKQIRAQEIKIGELEGAQSHGNRRRSSNSSFLPVQILQAIPSNSTDEVETVPQTRQKSGKQRSSSTNFQRESLSRRSSLQSILPDDYKKAVATLPPILGNLNNNGIPFNVMTINAETSTKSDNSNGRSRKSSLVHSSNPILGRIVKSNNNNNASLFAEDEDKCGGETQFYFTK